MRSELRLSYLNQYLQAFGQLNVNRQQGRTSPHKPCMLLAVLGLAEAANLAENRIEFAPPLLERYARIFEAVRTERDHLNPYFPFFHLQRDRFWHLRALAGKEEAGMRTARSVADIIENVQHAFLDEALHELMLDEPARMALRDQLIVVWFGSRSDMLRQVLNDERRISQYETKLRGVVEGETLLVAREPACTDTRCRVSSRRDPDL